MPYQESEWLIQQRELNAAAQEILNKCLDECLERANAALAEDDVDGAVRNTLLATIAADVDSRKGVVDCIQAGLAEMGSRWSSLAPQVADGTMTVEEANAEVHGTVEQVIAHAISQVSWPGLLSSEEVHVIAGLCGWFADDMDIVDDLHDPDEDDDDHPYYDDGDWHA